LQDGVSHWQSLGLLDGPVPIEVVLTTDIFHGCGKDGPGWQDEAEDNRMAALAQFPNPPRTQEIPAGSDFLDSDAGSPCGNYEDLVVA
jgi:hypothetical protein